MSFKKPARPQPLPLGALAAGVGLSLLGGAAFAQTAPAAATASAASSAAPSVSAAAAGDAKTLPAVSVTATTIHEAPAAKQAYQAVTTTIGKGKQALRDIPQSVTVVTEKLITDRNLDTVKEALHQTAGITFQAAEGGEEDIRLRGFSLQSTGDIFIDGVRDPAFYERDTFNLDRLELLRGSASMLFGRGSTGGAVNQVSKTPYLANANEVSYTQGTHDYGRLTGDFNVQTGEQAALRVTGMVTKADNNGAGASLNKRGIAAAYRWNIGTPDEFQAQVYHLENKNGINYGIPWIKPKASDGQGAQTINTKLDPSAYFGMASDYSAGTADILTLSNVHKLGGGAEIKTVVRHGEFTRDQRAGTVRHAGTTTSATSPLRNPAVVDLSNFSSATVLNRGNQSKIQDMTLTNLQSDFTGKFNALGLKHDVTTGVDYSREQRTVYAASGVTKPQTRAGTPDDGATINEGARTITLNNKFTAIGLGAYAQDLLQIAPHWKLLGGLRYDLMKGNYDTTTGTVRHYEQNIYNWSKRAGVLYQPNALHSFHASYGTSFNTSGDTYSYNAQSANTPPESSENIELGAKLDSEDGRVTTRLALFRATKNNERNTDPDNAATKLLLSGKRHATGFDMDVTGQITDNWEVYASYTWIPEARVDEAAPPANAQSGTALGGNRKGDRPGLTPKHSGTVWNTYKITSQFRAGMGVNFRSKQAPADIGSPAQGIYYAPGYGTVDFMGEYVFNSHYSVKANLSNAGNKLYGDSLYRGHYIPGAGRNFQVTLAAKF